MTFHKCSLWCMWHFIAHVLAKITCIGKRTFMHYRGWSRLTFTFEHNLKHSQSESPFLKFLMKLNFVAQSWQNTDNPYRVVLEKNQRKRENIPTKTALVFILSESNCFTLLCFCFLLVAVSSSLNIIVQPEKILGCACQGLCLLC